MEKEKELYCPVIDDYKYQNPIIFADYSDPDAIRVGDTYYLTASSFNFTPGLPILVSRDLVNWSLENYAIKNIQYDNYKVPQHAKGVWAPSIRFHEGLFYIYYAMPDEGIFVVTAEDALGEWSEPELVLEGKGLIDPCSFWDEDGSAVIVHGYARSRIGFKSHLGIFPISWDGKKAIGEDHIIFCGLQTQPTIEGPKVYKRDGYYYIFAPAGSVKTGWQTVLRSRTGLYGPFEEMIVLKQGSSEVNGPHQGALITTPEGEDFFLHFQEMPVYGRVVHMQRVTFRDGWPVMGVVNDPDTYCGQPAETELRPKGYKSPKRLYLKACDDFDSDILDLKWQWFGNNSEDFYSLSENPGYLRLYAINVSGESNPVVWRSPNVLTEKIVCPYFRANVKVLTEGLKGFIDNGKTRVGMAILGGNYAFLSLSDSELGFVLSYGMSIERNGKIEEVVLSRHNLNDNPEYVILTVTYEILSGKPMFYMGYQLPSGEKASILESYTFLPEGHQWVGAKMALYAIGNNEGAYGDFDYIDVKQITRVEDPMEVYNGSYVFD